MKNDYYSTAFENVAKAMAAFGNSSSYMSDTLSELMQYINDASNSTTSVAEATKTLSDRLKQEEPEIYSVPAKNLTNVQNDGTVIKFKNGSYIGVVEEAEPPLRSEMKTLNFEGELAIELPTVEFTEVYSDAKFDWEKEARQAVPSNQEQSVQKSSERPTRELKTHICLRRDTLQSWNNNSPVLMLGEVAVAFDPILDKVYLKIGDGKRTFNELPYVSTPF